MNKIAYRILQSVLKVEATFNTLEDKFSLSYEDLLKEAQGSDERLLPGHAISYNHMSLFGGIYIEDNSADGNEHIFAVEIIAYKNIETAKGVTNAVCAVATPVILENSTDDPNDVNSYMLSGQHYVTVIQDDNYIPIIHDMKTQLTVESVYLKHVAGSLSEYLQNR